MIDIKLTENGDISVSALGDISVVDSVRQAVIVKLKWIHDEWRLGPELGFPWLEDIFVKNPNIQRIKMLIRNEISHVEGVSNAKVTDVKYDLKKRTATFHFSYAVNEEVFNEEVTLYE